MMKNRAFVRRINESLAIFFKTPRFLRTHALLKSRLCHNVASTRREWVDCMTDVVVRINISDSGSESKLFEAVDKFASKQSAKSKVINGAGDAPVIMIKTVPDGTHSKKKVIFQDQRSAEEFLYFWRRYEHAS